MALYQPRLEDGHGEVILQGHPPLAASRVTAPLLEVDQPRLVPARVKCAVELQLLEEGSLGLRGLVMLPIADPSVAIEMLVDVLGFERHLPVGAIVVFLRLEVISERPEVLSPCRGRRRLVKVVRPER